MYIYTYVHIYIHIYTHTHIYIYIYIYILSSRMICVPNRNFFTLPYWRVTAFICICTTIYTYICIYKFKYLPHVPWLLRTNFYLILKEKNI